MFVAIVSRNDILHLQSIGVLYLEWSILYADFVEWSDLLELPCSVDFMVSGYQN
jgi:hypothetical protein